MATRSPIRSAAKSRQLVVMGTMLIVLGCLGLVFVSGQFTSANSEKGVPNRLWLGLMICVTAIAAGLAAIRRGNRRALSAG